MKLQWISILTIFLSASAFGQQGYRVDDGVYRPGQDQVKIDNAPYRDCGCMHNSQFGDLRDLLVPVNIIGTRADGSLEDGRDNLTKSRAELRLPNADSPGLTRAEVARIRATTGYLLIIGADGNMLGSASAALVENNMTIVTAAHAFFDKDHHPFPSGTKFYFQNQETDYKRVELAPGLPERIGATGAAVSGSPSDYAVARLVAPVRSDKAIPFPISKTPMVADTRFIAISSYQDVPGKTLDPADPVAQVANARAVNPSTTSAPLDYYTDADMVPGGSGGVALVRGDGGLSIAGIIVSSGHEDLNGRPYAAGKNYVTGMQEHSYTRVVGISGDFKSAISAVRDMAGNVPGLISTPTPL